MQRCTQSAAGGISHRLYPGGAILCFLSRNEKADIVPRWLAFLRLALWSECDPTGTHGKLGEICPFGVFFRR
jgi:hypothetical protein